MTLQCHAHLVDNKVPLRFKGSILLSCANPVSPYSSVFTVLKYVFVFFYFYVFVISVFVVVASLYVVEIWVVSTWASSFPLSLLHPQFVSGSSGISNAAPTSTIALTFSGIGRSEGAVPTIAWVGPRVARAVSMAFGSVTAYSILLSFTAEAMVA